MKDESPLEKDQSAIDFSVRLNELLDARHYESKGKGRQVALAKKYVVSQTATRKWLEGLGFPKFTQVAKIARDFKCNFEWLALGTGLMDAETSPNGRLAQTLRRLEASPPETTALIELALLEDLELEQSPLPSSVKGLVTFLKKQIKEEMHNHPREKNDPAEAKRITDLLERS